MDSFKNYLLDKFGDTAENLSKSDKGNSLVDDKFRMISLDDVATDMNNLFDRSTENYASVDALHIVEKDDFFEFYFFEFKIKDFNLQEDKSQYSYKLKEQLALMENCEHNCDFFTEIKKCSKELIDKSFAKLKIKPYDSLAIIHFCMDKFFESKSSKDCAHDLFNIKKYYILVSKTKGEYTLEDDKKNCNSVRKNKSNRNKINRPLRFMTRLRPYHYDHVASLTNEGFKKLLNKFEN